MFKRLDQTYSYNQQMVMNVLQDEPNPLNRISKIIPDGSKVLDIGAGAGLLAHVLHAEHKNLIIDGIEPNQRAAQLAWDSKRYRKFHIGFAQDVIHEIAQEEYDFIVLADVIEHIDDPLLFLTELLKGISLKTKIIISVPNIAFGAIRIALLHGNFEYVDSGILEQTHLRFFTLQTLQQLIHNLDMTIEKLYFLQRDINKSEINIKKYNLHPAFISQLLQDPLASTYQFLTMLTKEKVETETRYFQ
ncbi:class I SAM-dependent methyltransferase [Pelosinus sp. sgz500959]|uniref:class I SAM-dependent methyltransferase n=1 Tax=Pelosinus sp. sgz500959 TaxID=3242472 RepID=UPI00366B31A2